MKPNVREAALQILEQVEIRRSYANTLLEDCLRQANFSAQDKSLLTQLVYGVLRGRNRLDWRLRQVSHRPLDKLDPWMGNILRLGVYQLTELGGIAPYAAVNESVKLARKYGHAGTAGLVNAMLRNIQRQKGDFAWPDINKTPADYLAVKYSLPGWLAQRWLARYGLAEAEALAEAVGRQMPLTIRVNTLKTDPQALRENLAQSGWQPSQGLWPEAMTLEAARQVTDTPGYHNGLYETEGLASMQAVRLLGPNPGDCVLDACAGRGVKTTHLAQLMQNRGYVAALDNRLAELRQLRANCQRWGLDIVFPAVQEIARGLGVRAGVFDRILVDAPCTSLGVISRYPELRWQRSPGDIPRLGRIQTDILGSVADTLKSGGILVYSVCSFEPEENEGVIQAFLQKRPDYRTDDPLPYLHPELATALTPDGFVRLLPYKHGTDGFFMARLRKDK